jgi:hypothetical protein
MISNPQVAMSKQNAPSKQDRWYELVREELHYRRQQDAKAKQLNITALVAVFGTIITAGQLGVSLTTYLTTKQEERCGYQKERHRNWQNQRRYGTG